MTQETRPRDRFAAPRLLCGFATLLLVCGTVGAQPGSAKLSRLQGQVRESRTRDVVGATVLVQRDQDPGHYCITSSGADGEFHIDRLPDGLYTVTLEREGYATEVKQGIKLKFPFRAVVEVTMEPGARTIAPLQTELPDSDSSIVLRGVVSDVEGAGLSEIQLRAIRRDGSADPRDLRTPLDGAFEFVGLSVGDWRIEVIGVGYLPLRQSLFLSCDSRLNIQLVKQPPDYVPGPLDLMPPELPVVPEGFER